MRGKGRRWSCPGACSGITPAHAGKSASLVSRHKPNRDHPRTCGEKSFCRPSMAAILGSPPHMRGKDTLDVRIRDCLGITPAHAGKSRCPALRNDYFWDHPRTCGEKHVVFTMAYDDFGITPAHAGKSFTMMKASSLLWDHPRTCGEKYFAPRRWRIIAGSPPHMRGKALHVSAFAYALGITPAHAGKSPATAAPGRLPRDHPRTCGEK